MTQTSGGGRYDDIVVGAGHNGLTAAAYLARAGRRVLVLERADHVGGASVSQEPFPGVAARLSRYSYLVSLLPRRVIQDLDLDVRLVRRRYSSYTPVPSDPARGLLVDTEDEAATRASFVSVTGGDADFVAWQRFYARMHRMAQRVWPTFLQPLVAASTMRGLVDDDDLWTALTERPLGELLRTTFADDTVRGVVATDGLIGTFADLDRDLAANVCFLYHLVGGGTGDWDVPVGGMGAVSGALGRAATGAGANLETGADVVSVGPDGVVEWLDVDGIRRSARGHVHAGCAPTVLDTLLAAGGVGPVSTGPAPEGAQLKVNLLLRRLPRLREAGRDPAAAFSGTFHVREGMTELQEAYGVAAAHPGASGIPARLPCEVYCHTLSDRSILGPELASSQAQTLTLFGLHLPARLFDGADQAAHDALRDQAAAAALAALDSVLAEPISDVVMTDASGRPCIEVRTPADLQRDLGLPGGNIFHRALQWPWAERAEDVGSWGVETPYPAVTVCGAGARRGGGVSGIPGRASAMSVLS